MVGRSLFIWKTEIRLGLKSSDPHTFLLEAGVDPLIAMKIVGHTDYKTTANIYTHVRDEMLKKATVNMGEVFGSREKG